MNFNRRDLLTIAGAAGITLACKIPPASAAEATLPALPYSTGALEPYIDKATMEIHHGKHHQAYITNLNKALADQPALSSLPIAELLTKLDQVPAPIATAVRNNGGGHYNHSLFWKMMTPGGGSKDIGAIGQAINAQFGSLENFQDAFTKAALGQFGSGWAWLTVEKGTLSVVATANQDNPISQGKRPLLGIDVWEHAYYLKYQNLRADYIKAWWNVVNWNYVNELFAQAK